MGNIRLTVGIVAYLTTLGTGCTSGPVGEVKEVGPGTYSIGVSRALGGGILQGDEALKATVDKAGEHCHAKGQKLSNARARSRNDFSKRALARSIWMPDCSEPRSPAETDRVRAGPKPTLSEPPIRTHCFGHSTSCLPSCSPA